MTFLGNGVQIAVSQTSDPLADGWFVYNYLMSTDYQKLSIWSDGYYLTTNKDSESAGTSEVLHALERSKMLIGDPTAKIIEFPLPGIKTSGFLVRRHLMLLVLIFLQLEMYQLYICKTMLGQVLAKIM